MKNKSSESIMKLNQLADVLVVKKLKIASQNNSNGEEMKKNLINLDWLENFKNTFLIFLRNPCLQKA